MTTRTAAGRRRLLSAVAAGLGCCLVLTGCEKSATGEGGAAAPVTRELSILVSAQNGLYYPPFLRNEPAGPEDNSYAVRLRALLGAQPQLGLTAQTAGFLRREAVETSPLWGRLWLAPLASAGAAELLSDADADALRAMRTPGGWFGEPDSSAQDDGPYRAAATAAALESLAVCGEVTEEDRVRTLPWLRQAAGADGRRTLAEAADLARAFRLLGAQVPQALTDTPAPATPDFTALGEDKRYQALLDAYSYTVLRQAADLPSGLDATLWAKLLRQNSASLGFRDLYFTTAVAQAAGAPSDVLAAVRDQVAENVLSDGTVRDPSAYTGSPEAAVYGLRLRALAGESTWDEAQAKALRAIAADPQANTGTHVRLTVAAGLKLAAGTEPAPADRALCQSPQAVPAAVSPENAEGWSRAALACADLGAAPVQPQAPAWSLDDPAKVTAAATLAVTLSDIRLSGEAARWVTADELRPWAVNPARLPSVSARATVIRAYLTLGGAPDEQLREAIGQGIGAQRGCARLPSLYRADTSQSGCDLKATWAAWKLMLHQGGQPATLAVPSGEPSKK